MAMEKQLPFKTTSDGLLNRHKTFDHAHLSILSSPGKAKDEEQSESAYEDRSEIPGSMSHEGLCTVKLEKQVFDRWCQIREAEGSHSDSQIACLLLKWYDSWNKKKWCVECLYCQALLTVSLGYQTKMPYPTTSDNSLATSVNNTELFPDSACSIVPFVENHSQSGEKSVYSAVYATAGVEHGQNRELNNTESSVKDIDDRDYSDADCEVHSETELCTDGSPQCFENSKRDDESVSSTDKALSSTEKRQCKCEQCGKLFPSSVTLTAHIEKLHRGEKESYSENCKVVREKRMQFECPQCGKSFRFRSRLQAHVRTHSTDKSHYCENCKRTFKSSSSLRLHNVKIHCDAKPYKCDQCDMAFALNADLNIHKNTHKGMHPFICSECGQSFEKSNHLSDHMKQIHNQAMPANLLKSFRCEICHKVFKFKISLTLHMKSHTKNTQNQFYTDLSQESSQYQGTDAVEENEPDDIEAHVSVVCPECSQSFSSEQLLQEHRQTHSEDKSFACSVCEKKFKSKRGLYGHQQREHVKSWQTESGGHKCDKCDSIFRFKTQLAKHKRSHKDERPFSCAQCSAKFKSLANLRLHESWHEDMRSTVCHLCGKSSLGLKSLTRHIKMHHGPDHLVEKPYKCSQCTASFVSLSQLTSHRGVHNQHRQFDCHHCGQAFRSEHILTIHVRRHTGERPFQCNECQESFIDKTSLNRHQLQHTPKSKELCHVCGAGFPSKVSLAFHIQRHTTERPFKCSQCGKAYKTTGDLKSHMMSHSDDRPFQCSHCSYAARTKAMLTKHNRKHTGERPYSCEQCSAAFTYFSCLAAHRKLHSNTKPFVCEVCNAAFFTAYNLRLHSRKHSGERPYQCPICPESFSWHSGLKCHLKKHQSTTGPEMSSSKKAT